MKKKFYLKDYGADARIKITKEDEAKMIRMYEEGIPMTHIAKEFNVSNFAVKIHVRPDFYERYKKEHRDGGYRYGTKEKNKQCHKNTIKKRQVIAREIGLTTRMFTNFKYIKKAGEKDLATLLFTKGFCPYLHEVDKLCGDASCTECILNWLRKEHKKDEN